MRVYRLLNQRFPRVIGLCVVMLMLSCAEAARDRDAPMEPGEADSIAREIARYDEVLARDTTSNQPGSQKGIALREANLLDAHPHLGSVLKECYQFITTANSTRTDCAECTTTSTVTHGIDPDMSINQVIPLLARAKKSPPSCTCGPWGTCTKSDCSCDRLCPASFSIFSKNSEKMEKPDHQLAFSLNDSVFLSAGVPSTEGYCWGHAVVTQRFFRQADFEPNEKAPFDRNSQFIQWIEYYRQIFQDIVGRNIPRQIPSFKNLNELSNDPLLKPLLARFVANQWGKEAMSFDGVKSVFLNLAKSSQEDIVQFINEIESRISLGMNPVVLQTPNEASTSILGIDLIHQGAHVAVATRVERKGYLVKVCLMDANHSAEANQDCKSYLEINTKTGKSNHCEIHGFSAPVCKQMLGMVIPASEDRAVCLQFVRQWRSCNQKYDCHQVK